MFGGSLFGGSKRKTSQTPRSTPASLDRYKKPVLSEDQTDTLRTLLGDTKLAIDEDSQSGGDPHDNSGRFMVAHLREKQRL